jgi:hypothetical protein
MFASLGCEISAPKCHLLYALCLRKVPEELKAGTAEDAKKFKFVNSGSSR